MPGDTHMATKTWIAAAAGLLFAVCSAFPSEPEAPPPPVPDPAIRKPLDIDALARELESWAYWLDYELHPSASPDPGMAADRTPDELLAIAASALSRNPDGALAIYNKLAADSDLRIRAKAIVNAIGMSGWMAPIAGRKGEPWLPPFLERNADPLADDWESARYPPETDWEIGQVLDQAAQAMAECEAAGSGKNGYGRRKARWVRLAKSGAGTDESRPGDESVAAATGWQRWVELCGRKGYYREELARKDAEREERRKRREQASAKQAPESAASDSPPASGNETAASSDTAPSVSSVVPVSGPAEWYLRAGVELRQLWRYRDALAQYRRAAELADEAGDPRLAHEARALSALLLCEIHHGDEARALAKAEIAAGSPWSGRLAHMLVAIDWESGRREEAIDYAIDGWYRLPGDTFWRETLLACLPAFGCDDLRLLSGLAAIRIDALPLVESSLSGLRELLRMRIVLAQLVPDCAEPAPAADIARLRDRPAAVPGNAPPATPEEPPEPGLRFRDAEPSWRHDPSLAPIERELDECLLVPTRADWQGWLDRWSPDPAAKTLRIDGLSALFMALYNRAIFKSPRQESESCWLAALEEFRRQDGFDPVRLLDVLNALYGIESGREAPDPETLSSTAEWARRAAAGNPWLEQRAAFLAFREAARKGDAEAMLRHVRAVGPYDFWSATRVPAEVWLALFDSGGHHDYVTAVGQWESLAHLPLDAMTSAELRSLDDLFTRRNLVSAMFSGVSSFQDLPESSIPRIAATPADLAENLLLAQLEETGWLATTDGRAALSASMARHPTLRGAILSVRLHLADGDESAAWRDFVQALGLAAEKPIMTFNGGSIETALRIRRLERLSALLAGMGAPTSGEDLAAVNAALESTRKSLLDSSLSPALQTRILTALSPVPSPPEIPPHP